MFDLQSTLEFITFNFHSGTNAKTICSNIYKDEGLEDSKGLDSARFKLVAAESKKNERMNIIQKIKQNMSILVAKAFIIINCDVYIQVSSGDN